MQNRFAFVLLFFLIVAPFITGMGAMPQKPPAEETAPAKTEETGPAVGMTNLIQPHEYGSITLKRYTGEGQVIRSVVFPHWWHRTQFVCKVCHSDLGFEMKAGAGDIKMADIFAGKWCGACHNGTIAFAATTCDRCHSKDIEVKENRSFSETTKEYPADSYGNKINWAAALEQGKIKPKASLDGKEDILALDINVERPVKGGVMPGVIYPHKPHTQLLACGNCHTNIFEMKAGSTPITMNKINQGKYCGVCHGKVAFPLEDCFRCHSKK
ncbi:MAG: hypothetical protein HY026_04890 [Deltaproteobacteria bacterium]|nr:hypothetical protein [Deltaproteobacteria bacterium]